MNLTVASNNKHKIAEIKEILAPFFDAVLSQSEAGITLEVTEDGDTFLANAEKKARAIHALAGGAVIADDSGLSVEALAGAPGVRSARYAGEPCDDKSNNALLLRNMKGTQNRAAKFVCAVCLITPDGKTLLGYGEIYGEILAAPRGTGGFGYDPLFYIPDAGKTMAELEPAQKNKISHRYRALTDLAAKLK